MNKKLYIVLILILTIAFSTKAIANLTLGTTSVSSNGPLTLSTSSSTLILPSTNGTNGQVLTTNGSGVTSWSTVGGSGITNGAGANVIPKSDGTNLVGSPLSNPSGQTIQWNSTGTPRLIVDNAISGDGVDLEITAGGSADGGSIGGDLNLTSGGGDSMGGNVNIMATNGGGDFGQVHLLAGGADFILEGATSTITARSSTAINLDSQGGVTTIGDINNSSGGTVFRIDDNNSEATFNKKLNLGSGVIILDPNTEASFGVDILPITPGANAVGSGAFPFISVFVGSGANQSVQLTGASSGNRVATFPDATGTVIILRSAAPANATVACKVGEIANDSGFIYVCIATDTWKRAALATW